MSSNYYFHRWQILLSKLQTLVQLDQEYQDTKINDKKLCDAVVRLGGILGAYICLYNDVLECSQQNLQVQKAEGVAAVVNAVVNRILELKHQLRQLEGYQPHFLSEGLVQFKLTTDDAAFEDIPFKLERDDKVRLIIEQSFIRVEENRKQKELESKQEEPQNAEIWWDEEVEEDTNETYEVTKVISEENLEMKRMVSLIQAHERCRQYIREKLSNKQKRERWIKELEETTTPQPRLVLKERAAMAIQCVYRKYMELKRKSVADCKRDMILGIRMCKETSHEERIKAEKIKEHRLAQLKIFNSEWKSQCAKIKQDYLARKHDEVCEDFRDNIRDWLLEWYETIKFFHEIPNDNVGGSAVILRGDIPPPAEWLEMYKAYLDAKKKKAGKSAQELKFEKMAAKMEEINAKKEILMKKKREELLKKKLMKNPTMHPGYCYPESKNTINIFQALHEYHKAWDDLDAKEIIEVKERNLRDLDVDNMYKEAKTEVIPEVDEDMRIELKKLKVALKNDYENEGETMPEGIKEKKRRQKKKKLPKLPANEVIAEKMEYLAEQNIIKEYPPTKLEDFIGDPNLAGDKFRCLNNLALPYSGEIRDIWWERCRELALGFRKILLVGPSGSGKTNLVRAMATLNDAVLFELDPAQLDDELLSAARLQHIISAVVAGARAAQPAVIHLSRVHQLFCRKVAESVLSEPELIRQYLITKLFKAINKTDKITVIGTCSDPWTTKTAKLLKKFSEVILMPDTSYSIVVQILTDWVASNHSIPNDLDVHSLAHMLRGYSFCFIEDVLKHYLEPAQVVRTAAQGLFATDILEYVLSTGVEKNDYEKYLKWYSDNTAWGKKEKKQLEEAREFAALLIKYANKKK